MAAALRKKWHGLIRFQMHLLKHHLDLWLARETLRVADGKPAILEVNGVNAVSAASTHLQIALDAFEGDGPS